MNNALYWIASLIVLINCKPAKKDIAFIDFKATPCFGTCPVFTMSIKEDGTADYHAGRFNNLNGHFTSVIHQPQLDSLMTLIESAHVFNLKNNYSSSWTDHPTYTFTVKLKNGRSKKIVDYGPVGPDELKRVYDFIFTLRNTQDWK